MSSPTILALTAFISWALALLILMEILRTKLVIAKKTVVTSFVPDNSNLSPFMQRLARAHANCIEGIPIFGGLMLIAIATDRTSVTNSLALVLLAARITQSLIHLSSSSSTAINLRFLAFAVQVGIAVYWCYGLLLGHWRNVA